MPEQLPDVRDNTAAIPTHASLINRRCREHTSTWQRQPRALIDHRVWRDFRAEQEYRILPCGARGAVVRWAGAPPIPGTLHTHCGSHFCLCQTETWSLLLKASDIESNPSFVTSSARIALSSNRHCPAYYLARESPQTRRHDGLRQVKHCYRHSETDTASLVAVRFISL